MHVHLQGELGPKNDSETLRLSDGINAALRAGVDSIERMNGLLKFMCTV